ncbi:MAG: GlsB/YeaQ/YmgE family stress response membrane protein [Nevskiaceae bacterium]|jgi:uncharacterized membrane protein YeaQ/YmgE (transglycosylase-associated protein family)|nr:GlsB/YeaQ/YmgE family stress response membrane protein [Nevskiaceae bacterium]
MDIIIQLVVGGVIGWLASIIMRTNAQQGIILNIIVGIVGSFIGGKLLSPLLGVSAEGFSVVSLLISLGGAVILLAVVNLFRKGKVR